MHSPQHCSTFHIHIQTVTAIAKRNVDLGISMPALTGCSEAEEDPNRNCDAVAHGRQGVPG